jgi:sugar lactone lactonase YvrE
VNSVAYAPRRLAEGLVFPEGPRWHDGRLWLVDMHAHKVLTVDLDGRLEVVVELPDDRPTALGFLPDGTPLIVSARKRQLLALRDGRTSVYCDLSGFPGDNFNDMVVDGEGRAFVGNRFHQSASAPPGEPVRDGIVLVVEGRPPREVASDVLSPNGSVVTPDGRTLIVAQSRSHRILAFDIAADGSLSNRRVFADVAESAAPTLTGDRQPDGICLDAEGGVWFGALHREEFVRVVEGGRVTDRIAMPAGQRGIAVALGGPDRRSLFLLSAITTLENLRASHDYASELKSTARGFVDVVTVAVPGAGWP